MKYLTGDLLESDVDAMMHVANLYHTFGSGIASSIKKKWPAAYEADCATLYGCIAKLGNFSKAEVEPNRWVYNLYAMKGIGNTGRPLDRNCQYDCMYDAVYKACKELWPKYRLPVRIGFPYLMGCCRAGGSWKVVGAILEDLEDVFEGNVQFFVYKLEDGEAHATSTPALMI